MRRSVAHKTQVCRSKVKVTFQGQISNITHLYIIFVQSISLYSIKGFSNNYAEMFTSMRRCATRNIQVCLPKVKVTFQDQTPNIAYMKADACPQHNFVNYQRKQTSQLKDKVTVQGQTLNIA